MHILILIYNGEFRTLKQFPTADARQQFTDGVIEVSQAFGNDVFAAFWPEEAAQIKEDKSLAAAYAAAEKAVLELHG